MYRCALCGLAVIVTGDAVVRGCSCDGAVIADMSSTLAGLGGVKE